MSHIRALNKQERVNVQAINREAVVVHVQKTVSECLMPDLFPERLKLWESIQDTVELKNFIHSTIAKFMLLLENYSKGKDKYANLYLAWLDYIRNFTCRPKQTLVTLATLTLLIGSQELDTSVSTQRTVIAAILHAVQDGIQAQVATKIENLEFESSVTEPTEDDTALYRISGWALKSCIDKSEKEYKERKQPHTHQQLQLLLALKTPDASKIITTKRSSIPRSWWINFSVLESTAMVARG